MARNISVVLVACVVLMSGCASTLTPKSWTTLTQLQLRQRAGLYAADFTVVGASHAAHLTRLEAWASDQGIIIAPAPIGRKQLLGHVSYSPYAGWVVLLNRDLSPNAKLHTLLHELGHVFGPRKTHSSDTDEVIAEMVAASVLHAVGLDVWPQTAGYLVYRVSFEEQARAVQRYGGAIDRLVEKLARVVDVEKPKTP